MKLDSKQMHIVSQLFMAAGKAGYPFDLARFTKEASYASETLAHLSIQAGVLGNDPLQSLTALATDALRTLAIPANPTTPVAAQAPSNSQKYVGQLR
jgi:hypothetical protein